MLKLFSQTLNSIIAGDCTLDTLFGTADQLSQANRITLVVELYLAWLEYNPDHPTLFAVHYNLGVTHYHQGRFSDARLAWENALQRNPFFIQGHIALAQLLEQLKEPQAALQCWTNASVQLTRIGPDSGGQHQRHAQTIQEGLDRVTWNIGLQDPIALLQRNQLEIELVAIQNYGSSGTTLMHSLLDNHPRILSLPGLSALALYEFWYNYGQLPLDSMLSVFVEVHSSWFSDDPGQEKPLGLHQMGPNMDQPVHVSAQRFKSTCLEIWNQCGPINRRLYMITVYVAYAVALGRTITNRMIIQFPIHSKAPAFARYLLEDFPNCKFLHMIRHP
ncbi:MAG: tetratricopeptide repeat protein, partial [Magnetococcales bacterium]|nr:tetratricopeptide repeat protein [Magnetococcales bacterium]